MEKFAIKCEIVTLDSDEQSSDEYAYLINYYGETFDSKEESSDEGTLIMTNDFDWKYIGRSIFWLTLFPDQDKSELFQGSLII